MFLSEEARAVLSYWFDPSTIPSAVSGLIDSTTRGKITSTSDLASSQSTSAATATSTALTAMNTAKSTWEATKSDYKTACIENELTQLLSGSGMSTWYTNYANWPDQGTS